MEDRLGYGWNKEKTPLKLMLMIKALNHTAFRLHGIIQMLG